MTVRHNKDRGKEPYVVDIESKTVNNDNFRTTLWTGAHLQLTLMSIPVGGDIGLEVHPKNDQFLRLEQGKGRVQMGPKKSELTFERDVEDDWAILVPAGTWHNVTNIGDVPMKVYALYGPADHVPGTVHKTQQDAENDPEED
jgi:mannose-6-phosphate isomerase-like protein (cupin superfamily)